MHTLAIPPALPDAFCWSRMGAESGQELLRIVARKELERQSNGGTFLWGLGSPLGESIRQLAGRVASPEVLFSPISGNAAVEDKHPASVVLWLDYVDDLGQKVTLPTGSFVTSRGETLGKARKLSHYALFCHSNQPLEMAQHGTLNFGELRNLATGKFVGYSQVTAIVAMTDDVCATKNKTYPIAIRAELVFPYYVRLATPVVISKRELLELEWAVSTGSTTIWLEVVSSIKGRLRPDAETASDAMQFGF